MKLKNTVFPLAAFVAPALLSCATQTAQKDDRPNIIFILTDDMGFGDVGCYGGKFVPTPCIDRMAAEGIRFMQYYCASPISSPSRAGLLTGQHPARWHITNFLQTREGNRDSEMADFLSAEAPALPRALKAAGYKTAHFGKWHLGGGRDVTDAPLITRYGYDEYKSTWESPDPDPLITANKIWSPKDSIKRWERTAYFVDHTLDFLKRNKGTPCFINLWPDDVHTPWVGNFEEQAIFPEGEESEKNFRTVLIEYDRQIGRLIDGLKALDIADNTIVIFTSDNGPAPDFCGSRSGNYRGCKATLFEGGIRMPFIVWSGGKKIDKGKIDHTSVVSALDMFESLCQIAGSPLPDGYKSDGMDMSKALLGMPQQRTKAIFWEFGRNSNIVFFKPYITDPCPNLAVREGDWKLLINADGSKATLYNLHDDPRETAPLNDKHPDKMRALSEKALAWRKSFPVLQSSQR